MKQRNAYLLGATALAGRMIDEVEEEPVPSIPALPPPQAQRPPPSAMGRLLLSELPNVDDAQWTRFVHAMRTQQPETVTAWNTYGMFEMRPKRLADLGLMENLHSVKTAAGKTAWAGDWRGRMTEKDFLSNPRIQYIVFSTSIKLYVDALDSGEIDPSGCEDLTVSGALAVLHRSGPNGLKSWAKGDRFSDTIELVKGTNGIF